ncbi:hypothetical protein Dfri01_15050 [Dyadobacter frigoris]|nr:hypothetical protein Dfri01_15050 [Dyadobacter frigoris]
MAKGRQAIGMDCESQTRSPVLSPGSLYRYTKKAFVIALYYSDNGKYVTLKET